MTKQTKGKLKTYFESGKRPNQGQFHNLIDSSLNLLETDLQTVSSAVSASSFKSDSHITASGDISASGDIKSRNIALDGDITSSGHLSDSSDKKAALKYSQDLLNKVTVLEQLTMDKKYRSEILQNLKRLIKIS